MAAGSGRERPAALTCPTCGGAVAGRAEGGLPRFACRLGHRFAAAELDEAQFHQTRRVLETALRMFNERAELARRLAAARRKRGRPVSGEHWEATAREMEDAGEVLRRLVEQGWRPDPEGPGDASGPA